MGVNRHQYTTLQEVWFGYEWLFREKLEAIDHLTRQMFKDMNAVAKAELVEQFIGEAFTELWNRVAETEERKCKKDK